MSRDYPCVYYDNEKCKKFSEDGITSYCVLGPCSYETPSNADRIRAMTDEELAVRLCGTCPNLDAPCPEKEDGEPDCKRCWLDWLKQPCGGADHAN